MWPDASSLISTALSSERRLGSTQAFPKQEMFLREQDLFTWVMLWAGTEARYEWMVFRSRSIYELEIEEKVYTSIEL